MNKVTILGMGYLAFNLYQKLKETGAEITVISPATWYTGILPSDTSYTEITQETLNSKEQYYSLLEEMIPENSTVIYAMGSTNATNTIKDLPAEFSDYFCDFVETVSVCSRKKADNFIFFSSGGTIYGENSSQTISEKAPADPVNIYGLQKLNFEKILEINRREGGCPYLILRISNPYGGIFEPGRKQGLIPVVLEKLLNDEPLESWVPDDTVRDYIHVEDMSESIIRLASKGIRDETVNLGSGTGTSNQQIYRICETVTGKKLKIKRTDSQTSVISRNVLDISKLKNYGCMHSAMTPEDGIRKLYSKL